MPPGSTITASERSSISCLRSRMDIGTAKATPEEMQGVPHHMLDTAEPSESWSVAKYVDEAAKCCGGILARGRIPIITGGTGLYIDSLLSGRDFAGNNGGNPGLRAALGLEYDAAGGATMVRVGTGIFGARDYGPVR